MYTKNKFHYKMFFQYTATKILRLAESFGPGKDKMNIFFFIFCLF